MTTTTITIKHEGWCNDIGYYSDDGDGNVTCSVVRNGDNDK